MTAGSVAVKEEKSLPPVKYLSDYAPPAYFVESVDLTFELDDTETVVKSRIVIALNPKGTSGDRSIVLDGDKGLELVEGSLMLNGKVVPSSQFELTDSGLTIYESALPEASEALVVECSVKINPAANKALEGLYKSGGNFCTQCEAEGFRRITFYPDRPDVMSVFTTTIIADREKYPVLLSNGNKVEEGDAEDGKHYAKYVDPHRKPCYLFALVAGDLVCSEDTFETMSGRTVDLKIFVRQGDVEKTKHAMDSLKRSMRWDEETYGREYDLDIFNIVAVDDFNMGAMENKSLNIFNSRFVLVSPDTATDADYNNVEGIIAHEYFHNWTGNRVTCRDWFQLSLKEGLTVFRDQTFSADMSSKGVKRISDVVRLRGSQFPEDAGPMAHPIRPESFIEINNFYTQTVYQKGAEVIRMLHTLLGPKGFRKGTDLYFERHDGQAVTCEDWVQALQDANPEIDLTQFRRWYSQIGTPVVSCSTVYDESKSTLALNLEQSNPQPGSEGTGEPLLIPIRMGLLDSEGLSIPVDIGDGVVENDKVLRLTKAKETFTLRNVPKGSLVSLLRDFSSPIRLEYPEGQSTEELAFLLANETNDFSRWEAGQKLAANTVLDFLARDDDEYPEISDKVVEAYRAVLRDEKTDKALLATLLAIPSNRFIADLMKENDPIRIFKARSHLKKTLAKELKTEFEDVLKATEDQGEYSIDLKAQGKRALHNIALDYLGSLREPEVMKQCLETVREGRNMTEVLAALNVLAATDSEERDIALATFYDEWKENNLVILKWLGIQAIAPREDALQIVKSLIEHESFDMTVPNKVYAVLGGLTANDFGYHSGGQESYNFMADQIMRLDELNPQVASRMAKSLSLWKQYKPEIQEMIRSALKRIADKENLSSDVYEVVSRSLSA
eukprot:CAMPEP_0113960966 /NCGR_PEP_ID=MMETSP0011_2-20120614/5030_1 /TAXON_ID=101924 /ORGANISM="Rhodosorus marinus" /LENGTH=898 /DNA_ID=CAMNT_0000972521 /DNA_START=361 /DNA_END=3057 /DNA_ORIENTATION=+ /assembly_acc=CAM_ASM_000156